MKVELHPKALTEYEEAAHYYARMQQGLDLRFINGVEKAMRAIGANPSNRRGSTKMFVVTW